MRKLILRWLGLDELTTTIESNKTEANMDWAELSSVLVRHRSELDEHAKKLNDIDVVKLEKSINVLSESLDNRRNEIDGIIETLQNLDNHDVIADLHKRIEVLENKSKVAE